MKTADDKFLKLVKALAENYVEEEGRISIEDYNKELETSENEIEAGNFFTQDEVRQILREWEKEPFDKVTLKTEPEN